MISAAAAVLPLRVLAERGGIVVVEKPAGIPTEPDRHGTDSVVHRLAALRGVSPAVLHAATRLDLPVSGVVVLATSAEARRRIEQIRAEGGLRRRYVAIAAAAPDPAAGVWEAPVKEPARAMPRAAETRYRVIATVRTATAEVALLALDPVTGRTHQIRVHAAAAGAPLLGDPSHGGPRRVVAADGRVIAAPRVALHAARVEIADGAPWVVTSAVPDDLTLPWIALGGDPAAVTRAAEAPELYARRSS